MIPAQSSSQTNIFALALGDTLSPRVLLISLISFLLTLAFFIGVIWLMFGGIGALSLWITDWLQGFEGSLEQTWIFSLVSLFLVTKTIIGILFFLTSAIVIYYLFLMVYSVIVGLFSEYFIKEIALRYYPDIEVKGLNIGRYLWLVSKTLLITFLLLVLLLPLAFIPLLNFGLLFPVFYMFHKLLVLDVASMLNSKEEYFKLRQTSSGQLRGISLVCFTITLIPFLGVIIYPYYVIVMSHFIFRKTKELRAA